MNTGDRWLRSGVPKIDEMIFGSSSTSTIAMAVDLENGVNHGIVDRKDLGKEIVQDTVDSNMAASVLVTGCKSTCVNENAEEPITSNSMLVKETDVEYNYALILIDARRRRSKGGPPINLGLEKHANTKIMEIGEHSKNRLAVGPIFQAHRHE